MIEDGLLALPCALTSMDSYKPIARHAMCDRSCPRLTMRGLAFPSPDIQRETMRISYAISIRPTTCNLPRIRKGTLKVEQNLAKKNCKVEPKFGKVLLGHFLAPHSGWAKDGAKGWQGALAKWRGKRIRKRNRKRNRKIDPETYLPEQVKNCVENCADFFCTVFL